MRDLNLTHGREVLGVALDAERLEDQTLRGRLSRSADVILAGSRHRVRFALGRATVRLRFERPVSVRDLPELELDGRRFALVLALDSLDPSRRAYLARRLHGDPVDGAAPLRDRICAILGVPNATEVAPSDALVAPATPAAHSVDAPGPGPTRERLSPAARALSDRLEEAEASGAFDALHLAALAKRGLESVAAELVDAGLVVPLEKGHVIGVEGMRAKRQSLRAHPDTFNSREVAAEWGCSHGRARAILGRLVQEGFLEKTGEGYEVTENRT